MARRSTASAGEVTALVRRALDALAEAQDLEAAAERALAEAPNRQVGQTLIEMSTGERFEVTAALARAALRSGDPVLARTVPDLLVSYTARPEALQILRESCQADDLAVRARAAEALEGFEDPQVIPLLADALGDDSEQVRRAASSTVGLIAGTRHHALHAPLFEALAEGDSELSRALLRNEDTQVRRQAAQAFSFVASDAALPPLKVLFTDEDPEVRQEACLCLAAIGTDRAVDLMARGLSDVSETVASSALDMLSARLGASSSAFLEHLKKALDHPSPAVRRHAVLMLNAFDAARAVPVLERATDDADFEVARRAGELLKRMQPETDLDWLAQDMAAQAPGERALSVWEAGNIGVQTAAGTEAGQLVPMLERALRQGSSSDKVHALGELASLVDIADSLTMQDALDDPDSSVCSRAAETLQYTRDAGLLARVARAHSDPLVRRLALEALTGDPGGPRRGGLAGRDLAFSSTRTHGPELFSTFLAALDDPDEGAQQQACAAIGQHADATGLVPVRRTVRALEAVAEREDVSYLMEEEATRAAEKAREAGAGDLIAEAAEEVLQWRGELAPEAHALRWDEDAGACVVRDLPPEAAERWVEQFGLTAEQARQLRAGSLPGEAAQKIRDGLARELRAALKAVEFAAAALRAIGQPGREATLEQWARAVRAGPKLDWGPAEGAVRALRRIGRLRSAACVQAAWAREALREEPDAAALCEAAKDPDDWLKLTALRAVADLAAGGEDAARRMAALCVDRRGQGDYRRPVGLAGVALLKRGEDAGLPAVEWALGGRRVDFRMEMAHALLAAAQDDAVAANVEDALAGRRLDEPAGLCLALALRGAGHAVDALKLPPVRTEGEWSEARCARLGLAAMENEPKAAAALERMLRDGDPRERYVAAHYLALARVRSAAQVFASVVDQVEAPYVLRGLCAASLVRRGHPAGMSGVRKLLQAATGRAQADLTALLCRAVEDTIPLMIECADVDVGRFV